MMSDDQISDDAQAISRDYENDAKLMYAKNWSFFG